MPRQTGRNESRSFADLTSKRKKIVDAYLRRIVKEGKDPEDITYTSIRKETGVSSGYPNTVITEEQTLIDHLRAKLEAGTISFPLEDEDTEADLSESPDETPTNAVKVNDTHAESPASDPEMVAVPRKNLREFSIEVAALKGYTDSNEEDSAHYVLTQVEQFLQEIADENEIEVAD